MATPEPGSRAAYYTERYQKAIASIPETFSTQEAKKTILRELANYYDNCLYDELKAWVRTTGGDVYGLPMALHEFKKKAEALYADYPALSQILELRALADDIRQREVVKRKSQNDIAKERVAHLANHKVLGEILRQVQQGLAEFDTDVLQRKLNYFLGAKDAISAIKQTLATNAGHAARAEAKEKIDALNLSRTTYDLVTSNSRERLIEIVTKSAEDTALGRNFKIAEQLEKIGVTSIQGSECRHSPNGFDGRFVVSTPQGEKAIHINTIVAGGWNIQERHLRVLVDVRDIGPATSQSLDPSFTGKMQQVLLEHIESTPRAELNATSVEQVLQVVREMAGSGEEQQLNHILQHISAGKIAQLGSVQNAEARLDALTQLFKRVPPLSAGVSKPPQEATPTAETPALTTKPRRA